MPNPVGRPRKTRPESNPLVNFRAPRRLPRIHAPVIGGHFFPKRQDMIADTMLDIIPGDFAYTPDRILELDLRVYAEDASTESAKSSFNLFGREGFRVATTEHFEIAEHMRHIWGEDAGKRIVMQHGKRVATMVLVWRTGEAYDKAQKRLTFQSDNIQKTMEERMAESAEAASSAVGQAIHTTVAVTDEDVIETYAEEEG